MGGVLGFRGKGLGFRFDPKSERFQPFSMAFQKLKKHAWPIWFYQKNEKIVMVTLSVAKGLSGGLSGYLLENQHFAEYSGPSLRSGRQPRFFLFHGITNCNGEKRLVSISIP
jgi:hypothetical protein